MTLTAYHLHFTAPLHPGIEGIGQERIEQTIHSDTLWGALVQCWSLLYPESPKSLVQTCPFTVSSCFPFIEGRRYYPVPLGVFDHFFGDETVADAKKLKRVSYLAEPLFFKCLAGTEIISADLNKSGSLLPPIDEDDVTQKSQKDLDYSCTHQRPRLQVSRLTGGAEEGYLFYASDLHFNKTIDAGLFFLAHVNDDIQTRFEAALRLLGDTGLGADRTIGRGTFTFSKTKVDTPVVANPAGYVLLSLLHPTAEEIKAGLLQKAAYQLVRRIGYAAAPGVAGKRRPDLWMITEGSVLQQQVAGGIPEIIRAGTGISHPVYRYGRAFSVPCAAIERGGA